MAASHQVTCIVPDGSDADRRIDSIGGSTGAKDTDGAWKISLDDDIAGIENGKWAFYTMVNDQRADVIVASRNGRKYLKTTADGEEPNNLLSLPECP